MSTKAYDYFITGLSALDAADRIRETINPVFSAARRLEKHVSKPGPPLRLVARELTRTRA